MHSLQHQQMGTGAAGGKSLCTRLKGETCLPLGGSMQSPLPPCSSSYTSSHPRSSYTAQTALSSCSAAPALPPRRCKHVSSALAVSTSSPNISSAPLHLAPHRRFCPTRFSLSQPTSLGPGLGSCSSSHGQPRAASVITRVTRYDSRHDLDKGGETGHRLHTGMGIAAWITYAKERKLLAVLATAGAEYFLTGGLMWGPLAFAIWYAVHGPSQSAVDKGKEAAVQEAVDRVRREMQDSRPVTPPEPAGWMNRLMGEIWAPFVEPMLFRENLQAWQEKVRAVAPPGWDLDLADMSLGHDAPQMSNFQAHADAAGNVVSIDFDLNMDSKSMRVLVKGSGPLGQFSASVSHMNVTGRMRLIPIPDQRMMLMSFRKKPDVGFKLVVGGPVMGEQSVPQFSFLKEAFTASLEDCMVGTRRTCISLDTEATVQQAVNTYINIQVDELVGMQRAAPVDFSDGSSSGMPGQNPSPSPAKSQSTAEQKAGGTADPNANDAAAASNQPVGFPGETRSGSSGRSSHFRARPGSGFRGSTRGGRNEKGAAASGLAGPLFNSLAPAALSSAAVAVAASATTAVSGSRRSKSSKHKKESRLFVRVTNIDTRLKRETDAVPLQPTGRVPLNTLLRVELGNKEGILRLEVCDAAKSNKVVGQALLFTMAAKDGSTLFWAADARGNPLARRWHGCEDPWKVLVPLEGAPGGAAVRLALSADPWVYQHALPCGMVRTPGARSVVLQIVQARGLPANDWAGSVDPYAQITYAGRSFRTTTAYNATEPVWAETFVLPESRSLLARRVKLEVWDSGLSLDELLGTSTLSLDMGMEVAIQDRWIQLSGDNGEVRVRMAMVAGEPGSPEVQQMLGLFARSLRSSSTPSLQVSVIGARHLTARPLVGLRDAYADITFRGTRHVTPVVKNSLNPLWNYTALFPLPDGQYDEDFESINVLSEPVTQEPVETIVDLPSPAGPQLTAAMAVIGGDDEAPTVTTTVLQNGSHSHLGSSLNGVDPNSNGLTPTVAAASLGGVAGSAAAATSAVAMTGASLNGKCHPSSNGTANGNGNEVRGASSMPIYPAPVFDTRFDLPVPSSSNGSGRGNGQARDESAGLPMQPAAIGAVQAQAASISPKLQPLAHSVSHGLPLTGVLSHPLQERSYSAAELSQRRLQSHAAASSSGRGSSSHENGSRSRGSSSRSNGLGGLLPWSSGHKDSSDSQGRGKSGDANSRQSDSEQSAEWSDDARSAGSDGDDDDADGGWGGGGARRNRFSRRREPLLIRIELRDVDPLPPDDELGSVVLDVSSLVPRVGNTWEQWVRLPNGNGAEVQLRLKHLPAAAANGGGMLMLNPGTDGPGAVPSLSGTTLYSVVGVPPPVKPAVAASALPLAGDPIPPGMTGTSAPGPGSEEAALASAAATGRRFSLPGSLDASKSPRLLKALRGINSQVASANAGVGGSLEGLRTKLGQDWIPRLQDIFNHQTGGKGGKSSARQFRRHHSDGTHHVKASGRVQQSKTLPPPDSGDETDSEHTIKSPLGLASDTTPTEEHAMFPDPTPVDSVWKTTQSIIPSWLQPAVNFFRSSPATKSGVKAKRVTTGPSGPVTVTTAFDGEGGSLNVDRTLPPPLPPPRNVIDPSGLYALDEESGNGWDGGGSSASMAPAVAAVGTAKDAVAAGTGVEPDAPVDIDTTTAALAAAEAAHRNDAVQDPGYSSVVAPPPLGANASVIRSNNGGGLLFMPDLGTAEQLRGGAAHSTPTWVSPAISSNDYLARSVDGGDGGFERPSTTGSDPRPLPNAARNSGSAEMNAQQQLPVLPDPGVSSSSGGSRYADAALGGAQTEFSSPRDGGVMANARGEALPASANPNGSPEQAEQEQQREETPSTGISIPGAGLLGMLGLGIRKSGRWLRRPGDKEEEQADDVRAVAEMKSGHLQRDSDGHT